MTGERNLREKHLRCFIVMCMLFFLCKKMVYLCESLNYVRF